MNASRLAVHDVEDSNTLLDYRASVRLHDLSEVTQLLRPQPRNGIPDQPPFRTYIHHEGHRIPINRPAQVKPPAVISTYDEIREAALGREAEHQKKVERVRRLMMEMSSGSMSSPTSHVPSASRSPSSSSPIHSPSSFSLSSTAKSPQKEKKKKKTGPIDDSPTLLEEYEMMDDLRALLPLFSGNIIENTHSSPGRKPPSTTGGLKLLPELSSSTAHPPPTPNTYSMKAIKNTATSMTKFDSSISSNGRPLVITTSSNPYSPASNAIIEQYRRSIGRSDLNDSALSLNQGPSIGAPMNPRRGTHEDLYLETSPIPPPRPPRDSFENRLTFEPKSEDELLYEEEIKKHKSGSVITSNPFEALGLPSAAVFRSPNEKKSADITLKPYPPTTISPSKGNFAPNRRLLYQSATE